MPRSVLLVEDSGDDRFLTSRVLRKAGIDEIRVASDGREALELLFAPDIPLPELLILDLRLPLVDGLQVLAELRREEKTKGLPVLILTSSDDPRDRETCLNLGVIAYLTKPLHIGTIQQLFT